MNATLNVDVGTCSVGIEVCTSYCTIVVGPGIVNRGKQHLYFGIIVCIVRSRCNCGHAKYELQMYGTVQILESLVYTPHI